MRSNWLTVKVAPFSSHLIHPTFLFCSPPQRYYKEHTLSWLWTEESFSCDQVHLPRLDMASIHPSIHTSSPPTWISAPLCVIVCLYTFHIEIIYIQGNCKSILEDNDCWVAWWFTPQLVSLSCEEETYFACSSKGPNSFQQNGDRRAGLNFEHSK